MALFAAIAKLLESLIQLLYPHCVKRVCVRSYSGPDFSRIFSYSVRMRGNAGKPHQNNSEYGLFLRSVTQIASIRVLYLQEKAKIAVAGFSPNNIKFASLERSLSLFTFGLKKVPCQSLQKQPREVFYKKKCS